MEEIITNWQKSDLNSRRKIYFKDEDYLKKYSKKSSNKVYEFTDFESYVASDYFKKKNDTNLHLGLIPSPYQGNILSAKIYILMLNPGFVPLDYYAETNDYRFVDAIKKNLRQDFRNVDFPFVFLNPNHSWHSGASYWLKKLNGIIYGIVDEKKLSYKEVLKKLSNLISIIQLVPYHSSSFNLTEKNISELPSSQDVKKFVNSYVLERAKSNKALVLVTRKSRIWNLNPSENVIVYDRYQSRGAHITLNSNSGKKVFDLLVNAI